MEMDGSTEHELRGQRVPQGGPPPHDIRRLRRHWRKQGLGSRTTCPETARNDRVHPARRRATRAFGVGSHDCGRRSARGYKGARVSSRPGWIGAHASRWAGVGCRYWTRNPPATQGARPEWQTCEKHGLVWGVGGVALLRSATSTPVHTLTPSHPHTSRDAERADGQARVRDAGGVPQRPLPAPCPLQPVPGLIRMRQSYQDANHMYRRASCISRRPAARFKGRIVLTLERIGRGFTGSDHARADSERGGVVRAATRSKARQSKAEAGVGRAGAAKGSSAWEARLSGYLPR